MKLTELKSNEPKVDGNFLKKNEKLRDTLMTGCYKGLGAGLLTVRLIWSQVDTDDLMTHGT